MGSSFKSLTTQTLHYFARPHTRPPGGPLGGPAAWTAAELDADQGWMTELCADEIGEIKRAVEASYRIDRPMSAWTADDFPLPGLAGRIAAWRAELHRGRGLRVLRGLPVGEWSQEDAERFFWGFGLNLGAPGGQNPEGDLLGHVTDLREEGEVRLYRTAAPIKFHCDAADVVGLLCLRTARRGGASRIASSVAIFDELMRTKPSLARLLFEPFAMDAYGGGGLRWFTVRPSCYYDGGLKTFYHSDYLRSAQRHLDAPRLSAQRVELLDTYDALSEDPRFCVEMHLEPGDVQLLSNHTVVHSRTGYEDHASPDLRRHLLRLWLSIQTPASWRERSLTAAAYVRLAGQLARRKAQDRLRRPASEARAAE